MKKLILFFCFLSLILKGFTQPEVPFIINYTQKDYGKNINPETYCIAQDSNGVIYAGTANGIITYNGQNWNFIDLNSTAGTYVSALSINKDGSIFVGAFNTFGILQRNHKNQYQYHSFSANIKEYIGNIYKTYSVGEKTYFQGENAIYCYEKGRIITIKPETTFHLSFPYKNGILVRERNKGLYYVEKNKKIFLNGSEIFANIGVFGILKNKENTTFLTHDNGVWVIPQNSDSLIFEKKEHYLEKDITKAYGLKLISPQKLAVYSLDKGIFIIENNVIITQYTKSKGLKTNDIKDLIIDKFGNIWAATNNGISYINYKSPFSFYDEKMGLTGDVEAIALDGNYVGTSVGFFYKQDNKYVLSNIHDQVWSIEKINNKILIATIEGVYEFDENSKKSTKFLEGKFNSLKNIDSKTTILAGPDGIFVLNEQLKIIQKIEIPLGKTTTIAFDELNNEIWIGTQGVGVVRLYSNYKYDIYDDLDGLNLAWVNPIKIKHQIYFGNTIGLLQFIREETIKQSLPDSLQNNPMNYRGYFDIANLFQYSFNKKTNLICNIESKTFANIEDHLLFFDHSQNDLLDSNTFNTIDFGRINLFYPSQNTLFIGCSEGLIKLNTRELYSENQVFSTFIEKITLKKDSAISVQHSTPIHYELNTISFEIAAPFYENNHFVEYSFRLLGGEENWSEWNKNANISFQNLHEGTYIFQVKAKNIFNTYSQPATFSFSISAPWYRTYWAYFAYIICLFFLIYIIVKLSLIRLKLKNEALERVVDERTKEVVAQKEIIEEKHHEITASINYASRIQSAVLTSEEYLNSMLKEYFVLYKPRDIVSGDFYWAYEVSDHKIIWVAADCTGHGVPGGFMSMLGMSFLNEIIIENKVFEPDLILNQLRSKIIKAFEKKSGDTERKDGMDISLCVLDTKTLQLQFAGAYNPLYIVRATSFVSDELKNNSDLKILEDKDWSLIELKASKMPVGKHILDNELFEKINFQLLKGDVLYTFSDGFSDQFGGPEGKKFMSKRFKKTLLDVQQYSMNQQKELLNKYFINWIEEGNTSQIDDLCVVGVKI